MNKMIISVFLFLTLITASFASVTLTTDQTTLDFGAITPSGTYSDDVTQPIWNHQTQLVLTVTNTDNWPTCKVQMYLMNTNLFTLAADKTKYTALFNNNSGLWNIDSVNTATDNISASVMPIRYNLISTDVPNYTLSNDYRWMLDKDISPDFNSPGNISYRTIWENIPFQNTYHATVRFKTAAPWGKFIGTYKGKMFVFASYQ